jgi:hypothetical protein
MEPIIIVEQMRAFVVATKAKPQQANKSKRVWQKRLT